MTFSFSSSNFQNNIQGSFPPPPPRAPTGLASGYPGTTCMPPSYRPAPMPMPAPMPPIGPGGYQTSSYNNFSQQTFMSPSNYYQSTSSMNYYSANSPMGNMSSYQSFNSLVSNQGAQMPYGNGNFSYSDFQRSTSFNSTSCPYPPQSNWTDTGVSNGKSSIDLGQYKVDLNKGDSSITLTDKNNNTSTKVWGDPHIDFNANSGNKTSGMFNGSLTFDLPDNTTIGIRTQPGSGGSVSYADSMTIARGRDAYTVTGLSEQNSAPLNVQRSNGFAASRDLPQDGPRLMSTSTGTGWINEQTHQMAKASDFNA
jgi:hypothetical protein